MKIKIKILLILFVTISISQRAEAQKLASVPKEDKAMPYYDRHKIDVSNLRPFYNGMLMADVMVHSDGMFDAETKWKMTLYQMIRLGSNHYQLRSAYQLSLMGTPMDEILALWSPYYIDSMKDKRLKAAFQYLKEVTAFPSRVTADTHALLRTHFTDRQIAELMTLNGIDTGNALHDNLIPIPTDKKTLAWGVKNLKPAGWEPGHNKSTSAKEQRATAFVGDLLEEAYEEVIASWNRENVMAPGPEFESDIVNMITGYNVSKSIEDKDGDGVEDPYDVAPDDPKSWMAPGLDKANLPKSSVPKFNVAAYDFKFYEAPVPVRTKYPFSDRQNIDIGWTRKTGNGVNKIEEYFAGIDRATPMKLRWQLFFVYQLSSGCVHCQVHGSYGIYLKMMETYPNGEIPEEEMPEAMKEVNALFDFERSDMFTEAEKSVFRISRDAGTVPSRVTAAHIEDLRRHYSNREIQEILMTLIAGARLSANMRSQLTVTDRLSMTFALKYLSPSRWNPGVHTGWPNEQRPGYMSEIAQIGVGLMQAGKVFDYSSEWVGKKVPLALDADDDGIDDAFDGFPNDAKRWEDTDRDGIEDKFDDDIDGDGLTNKEEIVLGTFPYKADSDADGVADATEIKNGTDPVDPHKL